MASNASLASLPTRRQHLPLAQVLLLHAVPGVAIALAFVALARLTTSFGWPPSLALLLAWLFVGLPVLIGLLFRQGHRLHGTPSLDRLLLYRRPLAWQQYAWLVPTLLLWAALASTLLFPFSESLRLTLFSAWPAWLDLSALAQDPSRYSVSILWTVVGLSAVLNVAVPITEELYFRSFLLPRLPVPSRWAPLLSTVLFSLYHFWSPWDILGRILALLPVVYAVQSKRNVYVSILVHCLLNSIGTVGLAVIVVQAGRG